MRQRVKYPTPGRLPQPTKPFASINVEKDYSTNKVKVIAQILMDRLVDEEGREIEGAEFGLALDGSRSMNEVYGTSGGPFGFGSPNIVEPIAKSMVSFLSGYSASGTVELAYWAVGAGGKEIEEVGAISENALSTLQIKPKKKMGGETHLLPIIKHFVENKLKNAPWSMAIIVTDGMINDMDAVETYTEQYAVDVYNNKRKLTKLVLIGVGEHVDVGQLDRLDNFNASVDVDIWSAKLANEMEALYEVFDEVMSENLIVAPSAKIFDNNGKLLASFNDGISARFEFDLEPLSKGFKFEIPDQKAIEQDLSESLKML